MIFAFTTPLNAASFVIIGHVIGFPCLISSRHGADVALLAVPVRAVYGDDRVEREIVHGGERRWQSGRRGERDPGWRNSRQQRLPLPPALPGLGGGSRRRSRRSSGHLTQPTNRSVSLHLHNLGVLPPAGAALYHVPVHAAHAGRPSAASAEPQVRQRLVRKHNQRHTDRYRSAMRGCYESGNSHTQDKHQYVKIHSFIAQSKQAVNAELI